MSKRILSTRPCSGRVARLSVSRRVAEKTTPATLRTPMWAKANTGGWPAGRSDAQVGFHEGGGQGNADLRGAFSGENASLFMQRDLRGAANEWLLLIGFRV